MSFTFSGAGTKKVRLTVTDALSQTASVEHDVIVSTVVTSPPTITSFTPASGPTGTSVTISGTNFTGATAIRFNGVSASFTLSSATAIQATVPVGATTGPLTVTTPGGTATSASSFTVSIPSATLAWDPSTSSVLAGYNVYRSELSGVYGARLNGALLTSTMFTDSTLQSGHTYFYVVTAVTTGGTESGRSNEVSTSR